MSINAPGVYVEKGENTTKAISMASTGLTVFIGINCSKDLLALPVGGIDAIVSANEAESIIDGDEDAENGNQLLLKAVKSYFSAGGKVCYLANIDGPNVDEFDQSLKTTLDQNTAVNLVCFPGAADKTMKHKALCSKVMSYVEKRADMMFIMDIPEKEDGTVMAYNDAIDYSLEFSASSYTTGYYPWVSLDGKSFVPPCGLIAAQYGITDSAVGVHQAAAGVQHGALTAVVGVNSVITQNIQNAVVNESAKLKLNIIRPVAGYGICLWGARTLDTGEYMHLNVRRLFVFAEKSIKESLKWVVFEPNSTQLWGIVERGITAFLLKLWQQGALVGNKAEDAFYVKIDAENNPSSERDQGYLNIEIGMAPTHPAEFVVIKLVQNTKS